MVVGVLSVFCVEKIFLMEVKMIFRKYLGYVFLFDIEFDFFLKRVEVDVMF